MAWTADPQRHDSTLIVGDTWLLQLTLEDADGVAHDLTGVTGVASVRSEPGGLVVATPTVTVTSADDGEVEVTMPAEDTAEMVPGNFRYAVRLTWPDGVVRTIVEGTITARRTAVT